MNLFLIRYIKISQCRINLPAFHSLTHFFHQHF